MPTETKTLNDQIAAVRREVAVLNDDSDLAELYPPGHADALRAALQTLEALAKLPGWTSMIAHG